MFVDLGKKNNKSIFSAKKTNVYVITDLISKCTKWWEQNLVNKEFSLL